MKKIAIVAVQLVFVATPVLAENTSKMYFASELGAATYSNISPFPNSVVARFACGSHFSKNLAGEIAYAKFGSSSITGSGGTATVLASALQVAAIGSLPLNPQLELTGKLGFSRNSYNATSTFGINGSASQGSLLFGVGAAYHLNPEVSLRAQYDNYGKFENVSSPMGATAISLGLVFNL